jgi:hypothetical protein
MTKVAVEQCDHIFRSGPLFQGHILGGASLGRCPNKVLPGFVVCHEHVNKEALIMMIQQLTKEVERLKKRKHG